MKKKIFFTMVFVLVLTLCSFNYLTLLQFRITNRDVQKDTIEDLSAFYGYITLTWATLAWYIISGLIVWFVVQRLKHSKRGWSKWVATTGLIALFLAPGIFVDPDLAPNMMTMLSAAEFERPSPVLPAWVSILGYWVQAPYQILYLIYRVMASLITVWLIWLTWFVLLGLSLCTKVTRDFLFS
jgi:hypothetical protein